MEIQLSDLEVQGELISLYFGKHPDQITNDEVLSWITNFSKRFRELWESGDCEVCEIMKKLYN